MEAKRQLGLTFGDLRMQVQRMEEISYEDLADDETSVEFSRLDLHVRHMVDIQIAQELNEIKQALVRIADAQEEAVEQKKSGREMPFIH